MALNKGIYFNLSSRVLNRTSSHTCGRWYLPMFLLRDGLLTLIYFDGFMVLVRFWSSSYYTEVVNCCSMSCGITVVIYWEMDHEVFLEPLSKCSWGFSNIFFITFQPVTIKSIYHPILFGDVFLGSHQEVLPVINTWIPCFLHMFLEFSLRPWVHSNTMLESRMITSNITTAIHTIGVTSANKNLAISSVFKNKLNLVQILHWSKQNEDPPSANVAHFVPMYLCMTCVCSIFFLLASASYASERIILIIASPYVCLQVRKDVSKFVTYTLKCIVFTFLSSLLHDYACVMWKLLATCNNYPWRHSIMSYQ